MSIYLQAVALDNPIQFCDELEFGCSSNFATLSSRDLPLSNLKIVSLAPMLDMELGVSSGTPERWAFEHTLLALYTATRLVTARPCRQNPSPAPV